ncbi:MAG TPA: hypothetical protein VK590_15025 [Saprospiraceae bacterium]|nr:hypothetical protein [Saprospiraceae bacterium]
MANLLFLSVFHNRCKAKQANIHLLNYFCGAKRRYMKAVMHLLNKEIILEWRQRHSLGGIFLYVLATVFIIFSMIKNIAPPVWIALFWIIVLFAAANATTRSFYQESGNRQLFYYS